MYHPASRSFLTICLAVVTLTVGTIVVPLKSQSSTLNSSESALLEEGVVERVLRYPTPPPTKDLKEEPSAAQLYQHDEVPLGNRQPLLFVHGLRGEFASGFRWNRVVAFLTSEKSFNERYKVFYVRYNTHAPLNTVEPSFIEKVKDLFESTGHKPITVVALSMGGNLVQEAMDDPSVAKAIDVVVAMGTPFHGSPLFSSDWMEYSMIKSHLLPWSRLDNCIPYKMYFNRHLNLLADLRWDDADQRIPNVGPFKSNFPWKIKGNLTPDTMGNPHILNVNNLLKTDKDKFITYGGYLVTRPARDKRHNYVLSMFQFPYHFFTTTVPEHIAREHAVLRCLNNNISHAVGKRLDRDDTRFIYGMNDGITPLASALFLPTSALASNTFNDESDLQRMVEHIDVRRARVFRNIDHITFIDGWRPFGATHKLKDQMDPSVQPRHIFEWLLTDLIEKDSEVVRDKQPIQTGTLPASGDERSISD